MTDTIPAINKKCSLVNIYNSCSQEERAQTWAAIAEFQNTARLPCLIIGDFNEILDACERGSNIISSTGTHDFRSFLQDLHLLEIPYANGKFTWFRGNSKSKLNRLFVTTEWVGFYPGLKLSLLKRNVSDHCPLLVTILDQNRGSKPSRFLKCWLTHPGCLKTVKESWAQDQNLPITEKLKVVKQSLKSWNINQFGEIVMNIDLLENKLLCFDKIASERDLNEQELTENKTTQLELWSWMKRKEMYWAQQPGSKWLKEGDRNTRYFHTIASIRKRKNCSHTKN
ncbi:uncharacterized protein [Spinacia oleracea]|uniref:Endonuclease/exonuclease/phosphatase domain-containing protein n=1 Tax=Spinacia oleracea TaxID=3562 RepID=A0ABM3QPP6_SPIOL|nr:uncharacterized protein LOC130461315 [Spinacia oleracea]